MWKYIHVTILKTQARIFIFVVGENVIYPLKSLSTNMGVYIRYFLGIYYVLFHK